MAHLLSYDPCSHLSRAFSHYPSFSASSDFNRNIGFTLKACFDSNGSDNANRVFLKEKKKPYDFACVPHPHLLGDLEKGISVRDNGHDGILVNGENRSLGGSPTKPFCFPDQQLPQKLVVAVDVDEVLGNFVSALNEFIADRYSSNYSVSEYHVYEFFKIFPKEGFLPQLPSLTTLELVGFEMMETLDCKGLLHLTSVQVLIVKECPKLKNMVGERLPLSLIKLKIDSCALLGKRCLKKHIEIWPKISHIRGIQVNWRWIC